MGNQNHVVRETRLAKALFIVTVASLLAWLPFQILDLLVYFGVIGNIPYLNATVFIIKFLQFSNSLINVKIYPFRISEFNNTLLQMLHCSVSPRDRSNEAAPIRQLTLGPCNYSQE